eukprot:gnl/TRDRNA2_/TRDRNA2_132350_c0_seq1.p1 gnl/TRDRNA2_/TRDRNA2_132350_c0~~gnl/TRDRNA2_/TRDRNA2_132350_c0_seq1.p1  ORF type:complete len:196 (+),score=36.60 gnl/TRDRNA2_/TRDRNA2_132350_c0_seq1:2-589(+)
MCMIFALGSVSGAHFNPAVTTTIVIAGRGKITMSDAGSYILVQFSAGLLGAFSYALIEGGSAFPLGPGKNYGWLEVSLAEIIFTGVLCYVVLAVATVKSPLSQYFGFAIGSCVTVGGCAIGAVSGGSLNPAVSVGISSSALMFADSGQFWYCIAYTALEIIGAAAAAGLFMVTHPSEFTDINKAKSEAELEKNDA